MTKKREIASQKQPAVDKSLFDTYQMGRDGERLADGVISPKNDASAPRIIQKSTDVANSRMAVPPSYASVGSGRCK